jgi:hypothetical protein
LANGRLLVAVPLVESFHLPLRDFDRLPKCNNSPIVGLMGMRLRQANRDDLDIDKRSG